MAIKFGKPLQKELATLSPAEREARIGFRRLVAGAMVVSLAAGGFLVDRAVANNAHARLGDELSQPLNTVLGELSSGKIGVGQVVDGIVPDGMTTADQVARVAAKPADEAIARGIIEAQEQGNVGAGEQFILPGDMMAANTPVTGKGIMPH